MNKTIHFSFIGGDLRQKSVMQHLADEGHKVYVYGFSEQLLSDAPGIDCMSSLEACIKHAEVVVLPLPYGKEDDINAPFSDKKIHTSDLLRCMDDKQLLFAGKVDERLKTLAALYNVHPIDYMAREELAVRNAIPTAEGALEIAMSETPYTLHGANCLVIGYGRIGKILSKDLQSLGAYTYVAARKHADLAWIKANAMMPVPLAVLDHFIDIFDIIFNTAPAPILDYKLLSLIQKDCLVIDLASTPGGVDFEAAGQLGRKVIKALSLPGKVAPNTAGEIIKDTIVNILEELGV